MFGDSTGKTSTKIIVLKQITNAFCLKFITFVNERRSWCSLKISRAVLIIRQPYQPEYVTLSSAGRDINQLEQIRSSPAMLSTPPYVSSKHTVTWAPEISRCSPAMTSLFTPQKELWDGLERKERGKKERWQRLIERLCKYMYRQCKGQGLSKTYGNFFRILINQFYLKHTVYKNMKYNTVRYLPI